MMKYAYVEDGTIQQLFDSLPDTWKNISNFFALEGDESYLNTHGWYRIIRDPDFTYNPNTHYLLNPTYEFVGNKVYQRDHIAERENPGGAMPPQPSPLPWTVIRLSRDTRMAAMRYRYERYERNERLGLPQVDDIDLMDKYMQDLADITNYESTDDVVWPVYPPTNTTE